MKLDNISSTDQQEWDCVWQNIILIQNLCNFILNRSTSSILSWSIGVGVYQHTRSSRYQRIYQRKSLSHNIDLELEKPGSNARQSGKTTLIPFEMRVGPMATRILRNEKSFRYPMTLILDGIWTKSVTIHFHPSSLCCLPRRHTEIAIFVRFLTFPSCYQPMCVFIY